MTAVWEVAIKGQHKSSLTFFLKSEVDHRDFKFADMLNAVISQYIPWLVVEEATGEEEVAWQPSAVRRPERPPCCQPAPRSPWRRPPWLRQSPSRRPWCGRCTCWWSWPSLPPALGSLSKPLPDCPPAAPSSAFRGRASPEARPEAAPPRRRRCAVAAAWPWRPSPTSLVSGGARAWQCQRERTWAMWAMCLATAAWRFGAKRAGRRRHRGRRRRLLLLPPLLSRLLLHSHFHPPSLLSQGQGSLGVAAGRRVVMAAVQDVPDAQPPLAKVALEAALLKAETQWTLNNWKNPLWTALIASISYL